MSFKSRFFSLITLSVATAAFATFASAQETTTTTPDNIQKQEKRERKAFGKYGKGMHGGKRGGMMMRGLRGIDLTDAQKEQLRVIHENNKPNETVMQEMQAIRQAKRDGGTITPEQKERLKVLRMQAREKGEAVHQQVLAILTPEQRQQMETRKEEMRKKMEERRELRKQNKSTTEKPTDN